MNKRVRDMIKYFKDNNDKNIGYWNGLYIEFWLANLVNCNTIADIKKHGLESEIKEWRHELDANLISMENLEKNHGWNIDELMEYLLDEMNINLYNWDNENIKQDTAQFWKGVMPSIDLAFKNAMDKALVEMGY